MNEAAAGAGAHGDVEVLLANALRPVDPPETLAGRLEETLSGLTETAADELSAWADELSEGELRALRDPRNWVRPVIAAAVGGAATGALVVLEMRRRQSRAARMRARLATAREPVDRVRKALR